MKFWCILLSDPVRSFKVAQFAMADPVGAGGRVNLNFLANPYGDIANFIHFFVVSSADAWLSKSDIFLDISILILNPEPDIF